MAVSNSSPDNNALLVKLCVGVLRNIAPEGMTTKELAAELDKVVAPGFNGISSSILSSKLNAVFRRSHNDSQHPNNAQLDELPLTRSQSSEVPRRLVYRYTPPENTGKEDKGTSTATTTNADIEDQEEKDSKQEAESTATQKEEEEVPASKNTSNKDIQALSLKEDKPISPPAEDDVSSTSSSEEISEPLTPKEEDQNADAPWSSSKRRRLSSENGVTHVNSGAQHNHTASVPECPNTPPATSVPSKTRAFLKSQQRIQTPKFNLYYDAVGIDTVAAAFSAADVTETNLNSVSKAEAQNDTDSWGEFDSPESLGLNDLDQLVC